MLSERIVISPALEVAGSGVGERPSSPLRVNINPRTGKVRSALNSGTFVGTVTSVTAPGQKRPPVRFDAAPVPDHAERWAGSATGFLEKMPRVRGS